MVNSKKKRVLSSGKLVFGTLFLLTRALGSSMPVFISEEDINTIGLSVDIIGQLVSVMRRVMS